MCVIVALLGLAACGQSPPPEEHGHGSSPDSAESVPAPKVASTDPKSSAVDDIFQALAGASGAADAGWPIPDALVAGGDCPAADPGADEEIAAQASARVPLTVGLTLTELWIPNPDEEYECLMHVTAVRRDSIDATYDCDHPNTRRGSRRLCRADLDAAHMLLTETGHMTIIDASGEDVPYAVVGATWFSLSRRQFAELKRTGSVRDHYVQLNASLDRLEVEATTVLNRVGAETARVAVNDSVVEIPVIRVSGEASHRRWGRVEKGRITALIMDDENFPFLVDYTHSAESGERPYFRLSFAKVSFPDPKLKGEGKGKGGEMERQLAERNRVDVYGIYFAFNSDRIRQQSEPILEEIAAMLRRNPDWILAIGGHTDNVGGDTYNVDLSRRRAEAVRSALVDRFGIAPDRLSTAGYGAGAPKDTNDTPEGRARNRRVELVRQ